MTRIYTQGDEPIPGYRLMNFLGRGGFGEVWKASGPGGTELAIKIINLGEKQGLKEFRAIRMFKRIRHPNLVPINAFWLRDAAGNIMSDAGDSDSVWLRAHGAELIIAMGLGDKNLYDRLRECRDQDQPGIPVDELLDYMEAAAKGIDFLNQPIHELSTGPGAIQHCDIKPQNLLIVGGSVQVCDFGLAKAIDSDTRKTSEGAGSYAYIAPELVEAARPSKTTDQYSLAISYVELRTGALPFRVKSLFEVMFAHVKGKLDFSALPEPEQAVLRRAAALEPRDRYPSTTEMVKALRKAVEGRSTSKPSGVSGPVKPHELLRPGIEIVPGYRLVRPLGRGGYGEVWEAVAPGGKHVALKIIGGLEGGVGRQEFRALELIKSVDHIHLMELHAYWLLDGNGLIIPDDIREQPDAPAANMLVIATKLATKNLLQRLKECRQAAGTDCGIPVAELLGYMRQAAQAIDYLNTPQHPMGDRLVAIQHRDIKPENILLAGNAVKVGDFGLAKVLEGSSAVIHGDSTGLTIGYAAPEIFSNKVTAWSDQYSLALTYVYLRTGRMPFRATAHTEIMLVHIHGRLELDSLPDLERAVIARATALEPERRYPSCLAMVEALEQVCDLSAAVAAPSESWPSAAEVAAPRRSGPKPLPSLPDAPSPRSKPPPSETKWPAAPGMEPTRPAPTPMPAATPGGLSQTVDFVDLAAAGSGTQGRADETEEHEAIVFTTDPHGSPTGSPVSPGPPAKKTEPGWRMPAEPTAAGPEVPATSRTGWKTETKPVSPRTKPGPANGAKVLAAALALAVLGGGGVLVYSLVKPASSIGSGKKEGDKPVPADDFARELQAGDEELRGNHPDQAREHFARARELAGDDRTRQAGAELGLARAAARQEDWPGASVYLGQIEQLRPEPGWGLDAQQQAVKRILDALVAARTNRGVPAFVDPLAALDPGSANSLGSAWEVDQLKELVKGPAAADYVAKTAQPGKALRLARVFNALGVDAAGLEAQIRELTAIEQASDADPAQAAAALDAVLPPQAGEPGRPGQLAQAYASLALRANQPEYLARARKALEALLMQLKTEPPRQAVRSAYHQVLTAQIVSRIPDLHEPFDFEQLRPDCEKVRAGTPTGPVLACLAECDLMLAADRPQGLPEAEALVARGKLLPAADWGLYGKYVEGLLARQQNNGRQALEAFASAFGKPEKWQNKERRKLAAETYFQAATASAAADPEQAFRYFEQAVERHPEPAPVEYRIALAEAALTKAPPDRPCAVRETEALLRSPGVAALKDKAYRVLLLHARCQDLPAGAARALADYEQLVKLYADKALEGVQAADVDKALAEAIALDRQYLANDAQGKKRLAALYGQRGRLLAANCHEPWAPLTATRAAFAEAAQLYTAAFQDGAPASEPERQALADDLVWQGYLAYQMNRRDLSQVEKFAAQARQAAPNYSGYWFLAGLAKHEAACRVLADRKEVRRREEEAVKDLDTAIERADQETPPAELRDVYYTTRSAANTLIANYVADASRARLYLQRAIADADQAIQLQSRFRAHAYYAKGNAIEDLAWVCGENSQYVAAVKAFTEAIRQDPLNPLPLMARGRINVKRFMKQVGDDSSLDAAKQDLTTACRLFKKENPGSPEYTEARLWLGETYLYRGEDEAGNEELSQAIKTAAAAGQSLAAYPLEALRQISTSAWPLMAKGEREKALHLYEAVRRHCEEIAALAPDPELALTAAKLELATYYVEPVKYPDTLHANYTAAKKVCDRVLKNKPKSPLPPLYVEILLDRCNLIIYDADLRQDYLDEAIDDARDALKLADQEGMARSLRARASGTLGNALAYQVLAGQQGGNTVRLCKQALRAFADAIGLDPANPDAKNWRIEAAETAAVLVVKFEEQLSDEEIRDYRTRAGRYLDEAEKQPLTAGDRDKIQKIRDSLNRGTK